MFTQKFPFSVKQERKRGSVPARIAEQAVVHTVNTEALTVLPASPRLWPHPPLHQQQGCWSRWSIVQLLFLSLSRRQTTPYLPSLCSHRLARSQPFPLLPCSWTCPNHFLYHYWHCDYSFRSLFPELSRGCSSCSVSVRINLLTSISQTVALTGRLNWFHKRAVVAAKLGVGSQSSNAGMKVGHGLPLKP